ncbi:hypothetical protein SKAU_G00029480 [Synaphobranchus kaupii]|uniref:Uncharacterized protein n=1 Tax=Synaphobranchus kaupii TaxID=118154 RepID=A0A9Q1JEW0_SYNKA|nr:hypothetical protein SKAU_G00029480 [Synaphobranchus kaupii]
MSHLTILLSSLILSFLSTCAVEEAGGVVEEVVIFTLRCLPFLTLLMAVFYLYRTWTKVPAPKNRVQKDSGKEEEEE